MLNNINIFDKAHLLKILNQDMEVIKNAMAGCNHLIQSKYITEEEKEELIFNKGKLVQSFETLTKYAQKKIDREVLNSLKKDFDESYYLFEKIIIKIDERIIKHQSLIATDKKEEEEDLIRKKLNSRRKLS